MSDYGETDDAAQARLEARAETDPTLPGYEPFAGLDGLLAVELGNEIRRRERLALIQSGIAEAQSEFPPGHFAKLLEVAGVPTDELFGISDAQVAARLERRIYRPTWLERLEDVYRKARYRLGVRIIGWDPADD